MSMLRLAPLALLAASPAFAQEAPASVTATSPDGSLVLTVATDNDQRPTWSLSRKGQLLFAPSKLGFLLTDGIGLQRGFAIEGIERASADGRWEQPWGERRFVRDHHNELLVRLRQNESWGGHAMNVRFRLFDDGIGFRYELPEQAGLKTAKIADEITEFDLVPKGTAWWIAAGEWNRYEQIYQKTPVDAVATAHTPMTVRLDDGTHLSFHEAALVDYSGMWLKRAEGQKFRATLAPSSKGPRVVRDLPFATPWRTIRIAGSAAGLVESDLELNLNEPNKLGDVSWFKPMKYVGIWWGMIRGDWTWAEGPKHGATTERTKATIDFAAKHGFGGVLVEVRLVAPVRQRRIVVDPDEVDVGRRPERIEMEVDVAAAVGRMMAEIFTPVGAVGNARTSPQDGAHVGSERAKLLDKGKGVGFVAQGGEPAHFAADQEGIDATGAHSQMGVVKDQPTKAPVARRSGEGDGVIVRREFGAESRTAKRIDLRPRRRRHHQRQCRRAQKRRFHVRTAVQVAAPYSPMVAVPPMLLPETLPLNTQLNGLPGTIMRLVNSTSSPCTTPFIWPL